MFQDINIFAIIVSVVADMAIGTLWYSPFLFGPYWMKEMGYKKADIEGASKSMGFSIIGSVIMAVVLNVLLNMFGVGTIDGAIELAFLLWLGFVATTSATKIIYEKGKLSVYTLTVSYQLVAMLVMAIILTAWK